MLNSEETTSTSSILGGKTVLLRLIESLVGSLPVVIPEAKVVRYVLLLEHLHPSPPAQVFHHLVYQVRALRSQVGEGLGVLDLVEQVRVDKLGNLRLHLGGFVGHSCLSQNSQTSV